MDKTLSDEARCGLASLNLAFRSISGKAESTASVLLAKPWNLTMRSSKASSICIVIFMPY